MTDLQLAVLVYLAAGFVGTLATGLKATMRGDRIDWRWFPVIMVIWPAVGLFVSVYALGWAVWQLVRYGWMVR